MKVGDYSTVLFEFYSHFVSFGKNFYKSQLFPCFTYVGKVISQILFLDLLDFGSIVPENFYVVRICDSLPFYPSSFIFHEECSVQNCIKILSLSVPGGMDILILQKL